MTHPDMFFVFWLKSLNIMVHWIGKKEFSADETINNYCHKPEYTSTNTKKIRLFIQGVSLRLLSTDKLLGNNRHVSK